MKNFTLSLLLFFGFQIYAQECNPLVQQNMSATVYSSSSVQFFYVSYFSGGDVLPNFEVMALPCSEQPPTASTSGLNVGATTSYTFSNLQPNTCYSLYARSICPTDETFGPWLSILATTQPSPVPFSGCGDTFTDPGGIDSNYFSYANHVVTICPDQPGEVVTATFTSFQTESNWDALYVFDGNSTTAQQILSTNGPGNVPGGMPGGYWGNTIPGPFVSSSPDGCLTFWFRSDAALNYPGFTAEVTCGTFGNCLKPVYLNITEETNTTATIDWTLTGNETAWHVLALPCGSPLPTDSVVGWSVTTSHPYTFTNLTPGVCYEFYVRADCGESTSFWTGAEQNNTKFQLKAFVDTNNNGNWDGGEIPFRFGVFGVEQNDSGIVSEYLSSYDFVTISHPNPQATFDFTFTIFPEYAAYYSISQSQQLNVPAPANNSTQVVLFPVSLDQVYNEIETTIVAVTAPRAGTGWNNMIKITNNGLFSANGTLSFSKDSALGNLNVNPGTSVLNPTGFTHSFTNLGPGDSQWLSVDATVPNIPEVAIDQPLTNVATVTSENDIDLSNDSFSITRLVTASYDPNDIFETHGPQIDIDDFQASDYLYYTIRFQNTGNAEAFDVRVEHMLDDQFDFQSLRMVNSSHSYEMMRSGNSVTWRFDNINLTWQAQNEQLSQGSVTFKIKANPGFLVGDVIPATAEIYFDANPPVITETFTTTFVDQLAIGENAIREFSLYPNPANGKVRIGLNNSAALIEKVVVRNLLGEAVIVSDSVNQDDEIDISGLSNGIYLVEITTSQRQRAVRKLVVK